MQRTGSTAVSLEALVSQRLGARGVVGEREWDAWREDTGSWVVQVSFAAGGRARAGQWRFDPGAAHLEPMDDEARWLTARTEQEGPLGAGARRLSAVKVQEKVYDVEADGGVRPSTREATPRDRTVDLLDALRGRRGKRQPVLDGEGEPEQGDLVDELLEGADAPPPAAHPPASRPDEATDAEILALPEPVSAQAHDEAVDEAVVADEIDLTQDAAAGSDDDAAPVSRRQARSRGKQRRASVPSWDDIVFGARKD